MKRLPQVLWLLLPVFLFANAPTVFAQECETYDARGNCVKKATNKPLPKHGWLKVRAKGAAAGAEVFVAGELKGTVPGRIKLPPGEHAVEIKHTGFDALTQTVTIRRGKNTYLDAELVAISAIEFTAATPEADGASVKIDGKDSGSVPSTAKVSPGKHKVEVTKPGFAPLVTEVEVQGGTPVKLPVTLAPEVTKENGELAISANIEGAEIWINNAYRGKAPSTVKLPAGSYGVEVRRENYQPWQKTIDVISGKKLDIQSELKKGPPKPGAIEVLSNIEGAKVFLNGKMVGTAPVELTDLEPKKEYAVRVKAKGYTQHDRTYLVGSGLQVVVNANLQPTFGFLEISGTKGAAIKVDGKVVGKIPKLVKVAQGFREVRVYKKGFAKFREQRYVGAGARQPLQANLRQLGGVAVTVPSGITAKVYIDDEFIGKAPTKKSDLAPGPYLISVRRPGRPVYEREITVRSGKTVKVQAFTNNDPTVIIDQKKAAIRKLGSVGLFAGRSASSFGLGYGMANDGRETFELIELKFASKRGWLETQFGIGVSRGDEIEVARTGKVGIGLTADLGLNVLSWQRADAHKWSFVNLSGGVEFYFHVLPQEDGAPDDKPQTFFWFGPYAAQTFHLGCILDLRVQATFPLKDDFGPNVILGATIGYNGGARRECKLLQ